MEPITLLESVVLLETDILMKSMNVSDVFFTFDIIAIYLGIGG